MTKYFVEIDGVSFLKDKIETKNTELISLHQSRAFRLFCKENSGETLFSPFRSYLVLKTFCPIHFLDLRFQFDYITPKKYKHLRNKKLLLSILNCM